MGLWFYLFPLSLSFSSEISCQDHKLSSWMHEARGGAGEREHVDDFKVKSIFRARI